MKSSIRRGRLKSTKQSSDSPSPNSVRWTPPEARVVEYQSSASASSVEQNGSSPLSNVKANVGTLSKLRRLRSRLREQEQRLFAMTLPRRLGRVSQSDVTQPNGSPSDRFHSLLTQAAQIMELKKQQTKLQELLERQVATINGLQEEIQLKDKALDLQQQELERHRKHIAELELELEENEVDDALDVAEHTIC